MIFNCILLTIFLHHCYKCYFKCVCVRLGFDKHWLYCCACIYLDFSILFHCVISWPVLCHYGVQAWKEAAGEQGLALLLSHRSSPTHSPLPFCPSLFLCLYLHCFTLWTSNMYTVCANANLVQYDYYLSNMIIFFNMWISQSQHFPCAGWQILLMVIA